MAPRLFFDTKPARGFNDLLPMFEGGAFSSPFRSTVPLVALVKDAWPVMHEILAICGVNGELSLHFERRVESAKGSGRPSQIDAMVVSELIGVAVEAKWTEPRYPNVARRMVPTSKQINEATASGRDWREGQEELLDGWLELMRPYSTRELSLANLSDAVYQMVHRAASACAMARSPMLLYLHFEPEPTGRAASTAQYRADLGNLHRLIGSPSAFAFYLVEVPIAPTEAFHGIEGLKKGHPSTDRIVRSALRTTKLFEFGKPAVEKIGERS